MLDASIQPVVAKTRLRRSFPAPEVRRHLRRRAGLSQQDLAAALGVNRATIARYELGERLPRGELFVRYARLLDVLAAELSGRPGVADGH